jgi:hypothetical protein
MGEQVAIREMGRTISVYVAGDVGLASSCGVQVVSVTIPGGG